MSFRLTSTADPSPMFLISKADVAGRWDPFYFRPEVVSLERRIQRVTSRRLADFVVSMSGGATPSTREADLHYTDSDSDDGVPFIRVQNLSTTGRLDVADCKRISRATHDGLLRRSKLHGGELLVKITGVGRMAVASVVPDGFECNINQHIVAIRTVDRRTSESLAAYLNLDVAERLASRRATGGTRPALDYQALLSLPVVFDERLPELMDAAVTRFQAGNAQAAAILAQIDELLLDQLGVRWRPAPPDDVAGRIFRCRFSSVTGGRLDAHYHQPCFEQLARALERRPPCASLGELARPSKEVWDQKSGFTNSFPYVEIGSIDLAFGRMEQPPLVPVSEAASRARMKIRPGDLLVSLTRPTRKAVCFVPDELSSGIASTGFAVFREFSERVVARYLFHVLRSCLCTAQFEQRSSGGSYPAITLEHLLKLVIPLPSVHDQARIADLLDERYAAAKAMQMAAAREFEAAKRNIESLILKDPSP